MLKLIQFADCRAIWSSEQKNVSGFVCRTVAHLDVLPSAIMLEFSCTEAELGAYCDNKLLLYQASSQYYIPELQLNT